MISIDLISGLPGAGKTRHVVNMMCAKPKRYLYVTSRRPLIRERVADINAAALAHGTKPVIDVVFTPEEGDEIDRPATFSVASEIRALASKHRDAEHVIALCTHEGFMISDTSGFEGWDVIIDENPAAVASGSFYIPALSYLLPLLYDLHPVGTGWSKVVPREFAPSKRSIKVDDLLKEISEFDRRARSQTGVLVDVDHWNVLVDSNKACLWSSVWSPASLTAFNRITIAAAGYLNSLGYIAMKSQTPDVHINEINIDDRVRAVPTIEIAYLADHRGSTEFWLKQDGGKDAIAKAFAYLATVDLGYWATNSDIEPIALRAGLKGEMTTPRTEGTNSLRHHTSCAFIYSNKPGQSDAATLKRFNLKPAVIETAREVEDIRQYVMRGSLRNPDFPGTYRIYLYSKGQAETLKAYFVEKQIGDVHVLPIDEAGIMDVERKKPGRKPITPEQRLENDKLRKRKSREDKKALIANMTALKAKGEGTAA